MVQNTGESLAVCVCCHTNGFHYKYYGNHQGRFKRSAYLYLFKCLNKLFFSFFAQALLARCKRSTREKIYTRSVFSFSKIRICDNCGHGEEVGVFPSSQIDQFYKEAYGTGAHLPPEKYLDTSVYLKNSRAIGFYNLSQSYLKDTDIDLVEVGGGPCFISRNLRHHHPKMRIFNIEPGSPWYNYFVANDINLISKSFPSTDLGTYDVVISSHSLEHFREIEQVAAMLGSLVKPGGLLLIEVPNCPKEYFEQDLADTPHLQFFTESSLTHLLSRCGLKKVEMYELGIPLEKSFHASLGQLPIEEISIAKNSSENNIPVNNGVYLRGAFVKGN